jgi:hypothetical protein
MKAAWYLLFLVAPLASGCLELPRLGVKDAKPAPAPKAAEKSTRPQAPVSADEVTERNAQAKADALDEEIARDEQALSEPAEPAKPHPKKP